VELDPDRWLGELPELPVAQAVDWCTVVTFDELGEMRWTLVALEAERTTSLFVDRRPVGRRARAERVAERAGTDGKARPARGGRAARPD
jgi:hypothetical protein